MSYTPGSIEALPARPAFQLSWKLKVQVAAQPVPGHAHDEVTVPTFEKELPPAGRTENVAVLVWEVVGQLPAPSLMHVYEPLRRTRSEYWIVDTLGALTVNPSVAAATDEGTMRAPASRQT
jgi:hypothetical protein